MPDLSAYWATHGPQLLHYAPLLLAISSAVAALVLLLLLAARLVRGALRQRVASYFGQFLESEGVPSIRLANGLLIVVLAIGLEIRFCSSENVMAMVDADFVFAGTLLGLGTAKIVGKAFAGRPADPAAQIKAEKAKVDVAGNAEIKLD